MKVIIKKSFLSKVYEKSSKTVYFLPVIILFLYITAAMPTNDHIASVQKYKY